MLDTEKITSLIVVYDLVVFEVDSGSGVGDVESVALISGDGGVLGGENGFAVGGITGHGLVEEDVLIGSGLTVQSIIGVGEGGVF